MRDAFGVERDDISKSLETKYRRFMYSLSAKPSQKRFLKLAEANKGGPGFNGHADQYNSPKQIERQRRRYQAMRVAESKDKERPYKKVDRLLGVDWKRRAIDRAKTDVGPYQWRDKK